MLRVTALLMNKKQTAVALHISVRTVERLLARKELPRLLIGGSVRIPMDAVMKITSIEESIGTDLAQKPPVAQKGRSENRVAGLKTQLPRSRKAAAQKEVF